LVQASRLLPPGHPVRVYIQGRVPEIRPLIVLGAIPTGRPRPKAAVKAERAWSAMVAALTIALIGDFSQAIPFDPFGLPDFDLHLGRALGLGVDAKSGAHVLSAQLPWTDGSLIGLLLLAAAIATTYARRPAGRRRRIVVD
jgi:hypothetical protein